MIFTAFWTIPHYLYPHTSFFEMYGMFSLDIIKPNENVFDVCVKYLYEKWYAIQKPLKVRYLFLKKIRYRQTAIETTL